MTAVLGRMATYSGQTVKWDDAVAKGTSEFPEKLAWDAPAPVNKNEAATTRSRCRDSTSRTKAIARKGNPSLRAGAFRVTE